MAALCLAKAANWSGPFRDSASFTLRDNWVWKKGPGHHTDLLMNTLTHTHKHTHTHTHTHKHTQTHTCLLHTQVSSRHAVHHQLKLEEVTVI